MKWAELTYYVSFGDGDSSDYIEWEVSLTDKEEEIYNNAIANGISLNDIPELQDALQLAYEEIEEQEIEMGIEREDEYVMQCQGLAEVDPEEINDLIAERDPHALAFFGLEDAEDDEIEEWNAYDQDELPLIKDFVEGFEPYSPFDEGWSLVVQFVEPDDNDL